MAACTLGLRMTSRRVTSEPAPPTHRLRDALSELPLFPLPDVVLYPGVLLPLHVFEPRYRTMLRDVMRSHGALAVVQISPTANEGGLDAADRKPELATVAGAGLVLEQEVLADGRSNIVIQGVARVSLAELPMEGPYRRAKATLLEEPPSLVSDVDLTSLVHSAAAFIAEVKRRDPRFAFRSPTTMTPGSIADACAFHLIIDPRARQELLQELDPERRVTRVIAELAAQRLDLEGQKHTVLH